MAVIFRISRATMKSFVRVVTHERPSGTFGYETLRGVFSGHFGCELRRSEAVLLRIFVEEKLRKVTGHFVSRFQGR